MRLGQLARKLNVRPAEIVGFLASQNITIEEGSNVRLEEGQVVLVIRHFDAANADFLMTQQTEPEQVELAAPLESPPVIENETLIELQGVAPNEESSPEEQPEVIRAPKVELSGLKVLGKIELPEKKKKEVAPEPSTEQQAPGEIDKKDVDKRGDRPERRPFRNQSDRRQKSLKNPVALQREHEAREAEKRKHEQQQQEKERRTQHYQSRVKSAPTKPVKKVEEPLQEIQETEREQLSRWKRFIRWWNT